MSLHQRDEIRWNKRGYFERYDGKKYWRKLCVNQGCMKRAKVMDWCKRHSTEQKQKSLISASISFPDQSSMTLPNFNSIISSNLFDPQFQSLSQVPMPIPSFLLTSSLLSSSSNHLKLPTKYPIHNEIRINKHGYREQYDGFSRWRLLCKYDQCSKKAKKLSYCKRHYTEQINQELKEKHD